MAELRREGGGGRLVEDIVESSKRILQTMVCSTINMYAAVSNLSYPSNKKNNIYSRLAAIIYQPDFLNNFDTVHKLLMGIVCIHIFTECFFWLIKKRRK
jgi:hypothetical protein